MLIRAEKPITKEQYDRAQNNHGYIIDADMEVIFSEPELYGYGILNAVAFPRYNSATNTTTYYVRYTTSSSCD